MANPTVDNAQQALDAMAEIQRVYQKYEAQIDKIQQEQQALLHTIMERKEQSHIHTIRKQINQED